MVRHVRTDLVFHRDCWSELHATVQANYVRRAQDDGVSALLGPYQRATMASWLPEAAIEEVLEAFNEQIAELGGETGGETVVAEGVPPEPEHERPGAEPVAG